MSDLPSGSDPKKYYGAGSRENRQGLDRVSRQGFDGNADDRRRDDGHFSGWTWVMIVIAGVVLGVALAMIAAGA